MKIIHISDLHLCGSHNSKNIDKTIELFDNITNEDFDHLVISGDIAHTAEKEDYITLREILQKYNLLDASKTSIVIGNHDIFGGVVTAEDVVNFPGKCKNTDYKVKVQEFYEHFRELFYGCVFPDDGSLYPYLKIVENTAFFGINSVDEYSLVKNPLASNGKISKSQLLALKNIAKKNDLSGKDKIAVVHHHFSKFTKDSTHLNNPVWDRIEKSTMKLRRKKRIVSVFSEVGIRLVLHGHIHKSSVYEKEGIKFVNAGDSVDNSHKKNIKYQLIDVDETIICKQMEYRLEPEPFETDETKTYPVGII